MTEPSLYIYIYIYIYKIWSDDCIGKKLPIIQCLCPTYIYISTHTHTHPRTKINGITLENPMSSAKNK